MARYVLQVDGEYVHKEALTGNMKMSLTTRAELAKIYSDTQLEERRQELAKKVKLQFGTVALAIRIL